MKNSTFRKTPLAASVALALGATATAPLQAQDAPMEEIVVMGIRSSLISSAAMKRDAQGVSDGIVAEDIGKFPDTNLAESMQRITGVSIDRTEIGEGSRVTVRGVGPDFNLVTLNGRQMPGTTIEGTNESASRSFDFANLASEAVSAVNVYKTSQARLPSGGMGATVDIRTARPLDNPDMVASLGVKAVLDQSVENGDDVTPELSGIFSTTSDDGRFGVGISASYQDRNLGYNQAAHTSGWRTNFGEDCCGWGNLPAEGSNGTATENRPTGLYMTPQNVLYSFNDVQRERVNGQLVLQFAPTDTVTATLDYTFAENEIMYEDAELSAWNGFSPTILSSFTDGPVAVPTTYTSVRDKDTYPGSLDPNGDFGGNASKYGINHQLDSIGFNLAWDPSDSLGFELDFHDSKSDSGSAGKWGTSSDVGWFSFNRGSTTYIDDSDLPVLGVEFAPGTTADTSLVQTTGSSFRDADSINEVQQIHLSGSYFFDNDAYSLDFGVMRTEVENQSTFAKVEVPNWGGSGESPDDYDDSLFVLDNVAPYFSGVPGAGNSALTPQFYRLVNFDAAIAAAAEVLPVDRWRPPTGVLDPQAQAGQDKRTTEETTAAYIQFNASFELGDKPANLAAGLRYEKTDVVSQALVPIYTSILWNSNNEYGLTDSGKDFTKLKGDYDYVLPSVDFNVELTEDVILRLSYSETLGRPDWNQIQGGQTLSQVRQSGGDGNQGDPGLLPLESTNIDLSVEWYYGAGSYVSVAYFDKSIENYIATTTITGTPFDLPHPAQGARYDEANAATGGNDDLTEIRQYIFENYGDTPEVTFFDNDNDGEPDLDSLTGNFLGSIAGIAGEDPVTVFDITVPTNAAKSGVDGWEFAVQHFFGDSGFGVSANYTIVTADDEYNNTLVNEDGGVVQQFVLQGISDSANLVGFFENEKWSARLAYNWRDEYLTATTFDNQPNPEYVEAFGQWDGSVSYNVNDQLTLTLEGINITDEYTRSYVRTPAATGYLTTLGPRYMIGARYDFQ